MKSQPLSPGLYLVATPIGSARDITLRALDILASADVIAAEDTRMARKLMDIHALDLGNRPLLAYHDHSGDRMRKRILDYVKDGRSVAYMSDAGTPVVADPGFQLVRACIDADVPVTSAPGPSAVLAALSVAGQPTDRFSFYGFLPSKSAARRSVLSEIRAAKMTCVCFETARRIEACLHDIEDVFGPDASISICRELTKKFETVLRGSVGDLLRDLPKIKGECVIILSPGGKIDVSEQDVISFLDQCLETESVKSAAAMASDMFGISKKQAYTLALAQKKGTS